jgi:hypothetical protein
MNIGEPSIYEEKQRFKRVWSALFIVQLIIIGMAIFALLVLSILPTGITISIPNQIVSLIPILPTSITTTNPNLIVSLIPILSVVFVMVIVIVIIVYILELSVVVTSGGVYYMFYPFQRRYNKIEFEDIKQCYARKYRPVLEYGGWGIRYSLWNGRAYNIRGNKGVQLVLKNGKKILFGSESPEELELAVRQAGGKRLVLGERLD